MRGVRARLVVSLGACLVASAALAAQQQLTQKDADAAQKKIAAIIERGSKPPEKNAKPQRTTLTDAEVNAYLKFHAGDDVPKGVVDPQITTGADHHVAFRAIVDLDAVRTAKERSWLDPAAYITGSVEVKVAGTFRTAAGSGTFTLESATVGGVPMPKSLLQEVIHAYAKDLPAGFDLDKPFQLPAGIREVEIQRGSTTIIQ